MELILFNNKHKGIVMDMGKKDKRKTNNSQQNNISNQMEKFSFVKQVITLAIVGVITVVCTIVGTVYTVKSSERDNFEILSEMKVDISELGNKFDNVQSELDELGEQYSQMSNQYSEIYKYLYEDGGVQDQLGDINEALNLKVINVTDDNTLSSVTNLAVEGVDIDITSSALDGGTCLGVDADGNTYLVEDMVGKTILLTYTEGDKEVYFLGQYNEKYHWDGYCVFNSYNMDGTLHGTCESNYVDGKCTDYKSFTKDGQNWLLSDKFYNENGDRIGINIEYNLVYNNAKNFTNTNARITDIIFVDKFIEEVGGKMIQFYCGQTEDGWYNDSTGTAYLVKYDEDETINKLLYGTFVNGQFDTDAASSWSISYIDGQYYYYDSQSDSIYNNPMTVDEINKKVSGYNFECKLNWK